MPYRFEFLQPACTYRNQPNVDNTFSAEYRWRFMYTGLSEPREEGGSIYFDLAATVEVCLQNASDPSVTVECVHTCRVFGDLNKAHPADFLEEAFLASANGLQKFIGASLSMAAVELKVKNGLDTVTFPEIERFVPAYEGVISALNS